MALKIAQKSKKTEFAPQAIWSNFHVKKTNTIELRINRSLLLAIAFSLLVHLLALFAFNFKRLLDNPRAQGTPISVRLSLPPSPPRAQTPPPPPIQPPVQSKPRPKPVPKVAKKSPEPKVIATDKPAPFAVEAPAPVPARPSPPPSPPANQASAPTDMMSYVNAARERRQQAEGEAEKINAAAVARERKPSEDELRDEIIKRNLKSGTSGIFQIVNMGPHSAQFVFKGWTNDFSNARREFVQVEAGPDEDIKRNVVRKMIELIRRYYTGDFNWDSQRLGRVVVLSARPEDNAGLEDFLILEFFKR
jgi:hypothetical protein